PIAELVFARDIDNQYLRVLLVGGDRLRRLPNCSPHFSVLNNYAPTECTVVATSGCVALSDGALHIGRPISNTRIYLLDGRGEPVPLGVTGEIHIGGAGVARGYLNRPDLTAERFVPDRFGGECGQVGGRMYRTGDLARYRPDGNIDFLGRNDFQVKIRGFRIEPGEIEARLASHPGISASVVVAAEAGEGDKRLVAYYTGRPGERRPDPHGLRSHLAASLPDYMVPSAFVGLDALPLTANGK